MNTQYEYLLKPGNIGRMKLKNRVIFPPTDCLYPSVDGEVTQKVIDYNVRRSKGGPSLTVVAQSQACTKLDPHDTFPHSLRVDDLAYVPMLANLAEAVHLAGSKVAILVSAGGGAQAGGSLYDRGLEGIKDVDLVGATEKQSQVVRRKVRRLSIDEIKQFVKVYGLSAGRVKTAGFDAIFFHAWGGYLISQFLSPYFNTREDKYGKGFEGRLRFLLELIESCRKNTGPDFPIVIRLSIDEFVPGGRGVDDSVKIAKRLEEVGVDAIDVVAGIYESVYMMIPPAYVPKGCLVDLAAAVKREVNIPVIVGGRLSDPDMAEKVLREGKADFIAVSRGLLADPNWVNKVKNGQTDEIRGCVTCNHCIGNAFSYKPIRCTVNATLGRESEFQEIPPKAPESKKVVIVGAGPGGMETARIAAQRGHNVKLFEKGSEVGGQLALASKPPCREEFLNIIKYQKGQFKKLGNLEVVLGKEVTANDVMAEDPDVVVLATGASPFIPEEIEGIHNSNVATAWDVLAGKTKVSGKVIVAGGGLIGAETADELSEKGMDVTIVEMLEGEIAADEETLTRLTLLGRLQQKGVKIMTGHKLERITEEGITTVDKDNNKTTVPANYVVLALGSIPYNPLEEQLKGRIGRYYVIGDAKEPRKIVNAITEGFLVGYEI